MRASFSAASLRFEKLFAISLAQILNIASVLILQSDHGFGLDELLIEKVSKFVNHGITGGSIDFGFASSFALIFGEVLFLDDTHFWGFLSGDNEALGQKLLLDQEQLFDEIRHTELVASDARQLESLEDGWIEQRVANGQR